MPSLLLFALQSTLALAAPAGVDLHAHLFMREGAAMLFSGGFRSELEATSWKSRFTIRTNADDLESSTARIVVVALYTHPFFRGSQRDQLRRQIAEAEWFVGSHPDWKICKSPQEARGALATGHRCLVLSLEGASGTLETRADFDEFVSRAGIRIVTLLHFTDDAIGGPALLPGLRAIASPWGWIRSWFSPKAEGETPAESTLANPRGLTDFGQALVRELVRRGVWIDFSHASDASARGILAITKPAGMPLLETHTALREFYRAERGISRTKIAEAQATGGMVGLIPSTEMLSGTKSRFCSPGCQIDCDRGVPALAEQYTRLVEALGPASVSFGSDINAPLPLLPSDCPREYEGRPTDGFVRYSELFRLWDALKALGAPVPADLRVQEEKFIGAWSKAFPGARKPGA